MVYLGTHRAQASASNVKKRTSHHSIYLHLLDIILQCQLDSVYSLEVRSRLLGKAQQTWARFSLETGSLQLECRAGNRASATRTSFQPPCPSCKWKQLAWFKSQTSANRCNLKNCSSRSACLILIRMGRRNADNKTSIALRWFHSSRNDSARIISTEPAVVTKDSQFVAVVAQQSRMIHL